MVRRSSDAKVHCTLTRLAWMCRSASARERVRALRLIRDQAEGRRCEGYFDLAKRLLRDPVSDIRWQAFIVLGDYLPTRHREIWRIILRYGISPNRDVQTAVGTILLEHLLEQHFDTYFPLLARAMRAEPNLARTAAVCWRFGVPRRRWQKLERLVQGAMVSSGSSAGVLGSSGGSSGDTIFNS